MERRAHRRDAAMEFLRKLAVRWAQGSFQRQLEAWRELAHYQAAQDRSSIMSKSHLLQRDTLQGIWPSTHSIALLTQLAFQPSSHCTHGRKLHCCLLICDPFPQAHISVSGMETERKIVTLNGVFYLELFITTVSGLETERQIAMLVDATATWRENTWLQPLVAMLQARIRRRVAGTSLPRYSSVNNVFPFSQGTLARHWNLEYLARVPTAFCTRSLTRISEHTDAGHCSGYMD